jgi:hypothetical protein
VLAGRSRFFRGYSGSTRQALPLIPPGLFRFDTTAPNRSMISLSCCISKHYPDKKWL